MSAPDRRSQGDRRKTQYGTLNQPGRHCPQLRKGLESGGKGRRGGDARAWRRKPNPA